MHKMLTARADAAFIADTIQVQLGSRMYLEILLFFSAPRFLWFGTEHCGS